MAVSKLDAAGVLHAGKPQLFLWMPWTLALLVDIVWFDAQMKGERCVWGAIKSNISSFIFQPLHVDFMA